MKLGSRDTYSAMNITHKGLGLYVEGVKEGFLRIRMYSLTDDKSVYLEAGNSMCKGPGLRRSQKRS